MGTVLTRLFTFPGSEATGLGGYQVYNVDDLVSEKSLSNRIEGYTKVCVGMTRCCVFCIMIEIS
jgi:hypothetical protein